MTLFKQIIEGEVAESVFHFWLHLQTSLTEEFSKQQVGQVSVYLTSGFAVTNASLTLSCFFAIRVLVCLAISM